MGRGLALRVRTIGNSPHKDASCPQTTQQRNASWGRRGSCSRYPSIHSPLRSTPTGGQWTSALGSSHMSRPPCLAAAQATPTLGTKRPLSAFGPFLRLLLVPLFLLPHPVFHPELQGTRAGRNKQGWMWSDFMMKIEESWKNWGRVLKYFWTSDLNAASLHHYSSTTQQLRTASRALPPAPRLCIFRQMTCLICLLWFINNPMGLVSIPSLQDCEDTRTLVLWQAALVSCCCVTNYTQSYRLEITNIHHLTVSGIQEHLSCVVWLWLSCKSRCWLGLWSSQGFTGKEFTSKFTHAKLSRELPYWLPCKGPTEEHPRWKPQSLMT